MIYLCKAYEQQYQGLHGMYITDLFQTDDKNQAINSAADLSLEVMDTYSLIVDRIEEKYQDLAGIKIDISELYEDNIAFELYEVHTDKSYEELNNDLNVLGYKKFLEKYDCVEI